MKLQRRHLGFITLALLFGYSCSRYAYYGSLTGNCFLTSESITIPQELAGATLVLTESVQAVEIEDQNACLSEFTKINQMLVGRDLSHEKKTGLTVEKGEEFKVARVLKVEKHGLVLGPSNDLYYLVLQNWQKTEFAVAWVYFGINRGDEWMAMKEPAGLVPISADNFHSEIPGGFDFKAHPRR